MITTSSFQGASQAAHDPPSGFAPSWIADGSMRPFPLPGATTTSTGYGVGEIFEVTAATMVTGLYRFPKSFWMMTASRIFWISWLRAWIELHEPDLPPGEEASCLFGLEGFLRLAGLCERLPCLCFQREPLSRHGEVALGIGPITGFMLFAEIFPALGFRVVPYRPVDEPALLKPRGRSRPRVSRPAK
jgi:hypothetical protein